MKPSTARHSPLDRTFSYRLHLLHKVTDSRSSDAYLTDAGLPISEGRCLAVIGTFTPLSVVDLAQRANLHKGQASRAAQALVDRGLVRKTANATDSRGVVLALTRKGQVVWKRVMDLVERRNEEIFGCLNAAERQQLSGLLDRLLDRARRDAGIAGGADE
ncbi:MAG: MarR family transcriptional regulator [Steroidobacteraceae bacterium]